MTTYTNEQLEAQAIKNLDNWLNQPTDFTIDFSSLLNSVSSTEKAELETAREEKRTQLTEKFKQEILNESESDELVTLSY